MALSQDFVVTSVCPFIPIMALACPELCCSSSWSKSAVVLSTGLNAAYVIATVDIENPMRAWLTGLFMPWVVYRTAALFWTHEIGSIVSDGVRGQPDKLGEVSNSKNWARFVRAVDIFMDFRGVKWDTLVSVTGPKNVISKVMDESRDTKGQTPVLGSPLISTCVCSLRLAADLAWIDVCQTHIFPGFKQSLLSGTQTPSSKALYLVVAFSASFCLVDTVYMASLLISGFCRILGLNNTAFAASQPSPWGNPLAMIKYGIAGFWGGFWHNYFQNGFRALATRFMRTKDDKPESKTVTPAQICIIFGLSGVMHVCASIMLRQNTRPFSGELPFFLLQPLGMFAQRYVGTSLRRVTRNQVVLGAFNCVTTLAWLYCTLPLLVDDMTRGGFWDNRILRGII